MSVAVVDGPLVGVVQHLVSLAGLFELFFGRAIAGVAVRMIFKRQPAVGALQLLVTGLAGDAQYFVVVCFAHSWTHSLVCFELDTMRTSAGRSSRSRNR